MPIILEQYNNVSLTFVVKAGNKKFNTLEIRSDVTPFVLIYKSKVMHSYRRSQRNRTKSAGLK